MTDFVAARPPSRVAFVGTHLPRRCGIATFTSDLSTAVARHQDFTGKAVVVAVDEPGATRDYPPTVRFRIAQDRRKDYIRAANYINNSGADVVCLQHEYGIFGENNGANVLALLERVEVPVVTTCHTVLQKPLPGQRAVFERVIAASDRLVLMSDVAARFMARVYNAPTEKLVRIPHGVHPYPFTDSESFKRRLGLEGRRTLLTFGLLHPNKGVEHVIDALPEIVSRYPDAAYLVVGQTHPAHVREEGESYRESLQARVDELGLSDHVCFVDRFLPIRDLLRTLAAADILVTPYTALDHITSGALIYALSMGRAVVSTPYWYAREVLANGRGVKVPVADPDAIARAVVGLFADERKMEQMRRNAYGYCRCMRWPNVAESYLKVFEDVTGCGAEVVADAALDADRTGHGAGPPL